jgi:hypothetical protein
MTFKEYINLPETDQIPIGEIVKERTVARLIIKNSLNEQACEQLVETYSINNNACYLNTISEALSLLSTFKKPASASNKKSDDDAVVSYHETSTANNTTDHNDIIEQDSVDVVNNEVNEDADNNEDEDARHVTFSTTVMATVIAEATADADEDQFIGGGFAQLQDVNDAYENDEPDIVCCAHVVDLEDDKGADIPDFVTDANSTAEEHNEKIKRRSVTVTKHSDFIKDFELMIYHTAQ